MLVDPSAGRKFIDRCCELHCPKGFFGSPKAHLLRIMSSSIRKIPLKLHPKGRVPGSRCFAPQAADNFTPIHNDAPALITFTSGSTGQPKAVARSHEFLIAQHSALENALELRSGEIDLITLPVFALANLASGVTSVLADTDLAHPDKANAEKMLGQIQDEKVCRTAASPSFFSALLKRPESLNSLKRIATGGAPVFPPLLDKLRTAAPDADIFTVYGSTEAEPIAHIEFDEMKEDDLEKMKDGAGLLVGTPVSEIQLRIIKSHWGKSITPIDDRAFGEMCLPENETGEIVVSGDHVLTGYLGGIGDEETKFKVDDCIWHRTGDSGYLDEAGRLWLQGRSSAQLKDGSYPFSIECALSFLPECRRSAIVDHRGDTVLVVELRNKSEHSLEIPDSIRIDEVVFVENIPLDRRHRAKTDYPKLINLLNKERRP